MTDQQTLFAYRLAEAEETLSDAQTMLENDVSARSIVNRAYYAMFYAVIALLLARKVEHKTSRHSGIISIFDREVVHTGLMGRERFIPLRLDDTPIKGSLAQFLYINWRPAERELGYPLDGRERLGETQNFRRQGGEADRL